jgi:nicotinamidase-related amidase
MNDSRDVLVVVDVQNGFVNSRSKAILPPLQKFLTSWVARGLPVILTRFINVPGSQWETLIHWTRLRDSPETDLHPLVLGVVEGQPNVYVVDKTTYSSLNTEVLSVLDALKPDRLILCGIASDGCVLKTAVDAFEQGMIPVVLKDLTASHAGQAVHEAGLLLISRFIGRDQLIESSAVEIDKADGPYAAGLSASGIAN